MFGDNILKKGKMPTLKSLHDGGMKDAKLHFGESKEISEEEAEKVYKKLQGRESISKEELETIDKYTEQQVNSAPGAPEQYRRLWVDAKKRPPYE